MAVFALTNALILAGGHNLTTRANRVELATSAATSDVTTFASAGWREWITSIKDVDLSVSGFWESDDFAWPNLGVADVPFTVAPTPADSGPAYNFAGTVLSYEQFGAVGDPAPFSLEASGRGYGLARGALLHPHTVTRTASGTGTATLVGTVPAGKRLVVALHVLSAAGTTPSLTVTVQRDDNAGFTSPVTAHTFTAATTAGSQYATVPGPITPDNYYRVTWAISGTTPSFTFSAFAGLTS